MAADTQQCRRSEALQLLEAFSTRILPGILRRIASWKGISPAALRELREDVTQELAIDCLEHAATIVESPTQRRHARWIRLAERWIYHQHVRSQRRVSAADPDTIAAPPNEPGRTADLDSAALPGLVQLKNGRCNLRASARLTGRSVRAVRDRLEDLATQLDGSSTSVTFWQLRLAEALVGLGADLLRQRHELTLLESGHGAPDPAARKHRIRRLARRFPLHRTPLWIRKVLASWPQKPKRQRAAARRALEQATRLAPNRAAGWLWLFEAAIVDGDAKAAAQALRRCRQLAEPNRAGVVLARARLLELRGHVDRAVALVRRANRRWPHERRLRLACRRLAATD